MIKAVEVILWGRRIGYLYQGEGDSVPAFEYDKEFKQSGIEISPIMMPLSDRVYRFPELREISAFRGLPGLVADSLPDRFGNTLINRWLSEQGRSPESFTAMEQLCYIGKRGMGALEYIPAVDFNNTTNTDIDITEMTRLASEVLSGREDKVLQGDNMGKMQLLEIGSSAGGARAKAIIAWNEQTKEVRSGQINAGDGFDYWIIKFGGVNGNGDHDVEDKKQYTNIEYAYYLMAKDAGINMNECRLFSRDGYCHFMTKRFDRLNGKKIHMQTLAALLHLDYNIPNQIGYEQYAEQARKLGIGKSGIEQVYRQMVFNVVAMNNDDHVKNFSFLMDRKGKWQLAPAYDITYAYHPANRWISKHQMSVNGKVEDITGEDLIKSGNIMGLPRAFCRDVLEQVTDVVSNWFIYAEKSELSKERTEEIYGNLENSVRPVSE